MTKSAPSKSKISLKSLHIIFVVILILLALNAIFVISNLEKTQNNIAETKTDKSHDLIISELDNYFKSIEVIVDMASNHASSDYIFYDSKHGLKSYFQPILQLSEHVKYALLSKPSGAQQIVYKRDSQLIEINRESNIYQSKEVFKAWHLTKDGQWLLNQSIEDSLLNIENDWFTGATQNKSKVYWTNPYFYTPLEVGLTATKYFKNNQNNELVIGLGLTLDHISDITRNIQISAHGEAFVFSADGVFVGLPKHLNPITKKDSIHQHITSINQSPIIKKAFDIWQEFEFKKPRLFKYEGKNWYCDFHRYYLSDTFYFHVGVLIPQQDIIGEMKRIKLSIIFATIFLLIVTSLILYYYRKSYLANSQLTNRNEEIIKQRDIIEMKSKHILDSIRYAKHIQQAMLPSLKSVDKLLNDNFVLYHPKDVISGDFYWVEQQNDTVYFAVGDATGHGVPGAMVSSICIKALNQSVFDFNKNTPAAILDKSRNLILKELSRNGEEMNEGMDIALCAINNNTLQFSGANISIYIIHNSILSETKANRQPVGKHYKLLPFTNHSFELMEGDIVYILSDGFADQFGGDLNKKLKSRKLKDIIYQMHLEPLKTQKNMLEKCFNEWKGNEEQTDDICVLAYKHHSS